MTDTPDRGAMNRTAETLHAAIREAADNGRARLKAAGALRERVRNEGVAAAQQALQELEWLRDG